MIIYTAASFAEQERIRQYKEPLFKMGHSVISTWLEEQIKPDGMAEVNFERKMAMKDLQEVAQADCMILDVDNPRPTAGKMVEFGFALAKHKLIYVVGTPPPHAIFLNLADGMFSSWEVLLKFIAENHK